MVTVYTVTSNNTKAVDLSPPKKTKVKKHFYVKHYAKHGNYCKLQNPTRGFRFPLGNIYFLANHGFHSGIIPAETLFIP